VAGGAILPAARDKGGVAFAGARGRRAGTRRAAAAVQILAGDANRRNKMRRVARKNDVARALQGNTREATFLARRKPHAQQQGEQVDEGEERDGKQMMNMSTTAPNVN
jgi:hypothetical protein